MNRSSLSQREELEHLLSEDVASTKQREQLAFDKIAAPFKNRLVLFGAGTLGRKTLAGLQKIGIEPLAFADNNPELWSRQILGIPVLSPADAAKSFGHSALFVITVWGARSADVMADRRRFLRELGCEQVISFLPLFWKYPEAFLPHYCRDLPHKIIEDAAEVKRANGIWSDEASRGEFLAQLRWRLEADFDDLPPPVAGAPYFPPDLVVLRDDEVFVDCGAFDGDTLRDFLEISHGRFRKVIAFEPDPANFEKLAATIDKHPEDSRRRITAHQLVVGASPGVVRLTASGTAASAVSLVGEFEVECVTLDDLVAIDHPTFLKMDIEGAEFDALLGASGILVKDRPIVAVCVYHLQNHLWTIPLFLYDLLTNYSFFLRPHDKEGWDLVCYAIPADRLRKH